MTNKTIKKVLLSMLFVVSFSACESKNVASPIEAESATATLHVYKTPTCGCCADWVKHMEAAGLALSVENKDDLTELKNELGIAQSQRSCHTAISASGGYFFEGHIPAFLVKRFLAEPPENALGLSAPGMPMGSPGMEMGERFSPYDVVVIFKGGETKTYAHIGLQSEQYQ